MPIREVCLSAANTLPVPANGCERDEIVPEVRQVPLVDKLN